MSNVLAQISILVVFILRIFLQESWTTDIISPFYIFFLVFPTFNYLCEISMPEYPNIFQGIFFKILILYFNFTSYKMSL